MILPDNAPPVAPAATDHLMCAQRHRIGSSTPALPRAIRARLSRLPGNWHVRYTIWRNNHLR